MAQGNVNWFQISTDDPAGAEKFYGGLFGWAFAGDPHLDAYRLVTEAGADRPNGGIANTGGESPNIAEFFVMVPDVAAAVEQAERLGGKVAIPAVTTPDGLTFAHLTDPSGSRFGVYAPPAVQ